MTEQSGIPMAGRQLMAGRTVLVTGATGGIGKATALGLAAMGADVAITGRDRTAPRAQPARSARPVGERWPGSSRTCPRIQRVLVPFIRPFMKSPEQGAETSIHVATVTDLEQVSGRFFAGSKPRRSSERSYDEAVAERLWQVSAELVGLPAGA